MPPIADSLNSTTGLEAWAVAAAAAEFGCPGSVTLTDMAAELDAIAGGHDGQFQARHRENAAVADDLAPTRASVIAATALWTRFHTYDAADPRWPDRDRFVCGGAAGGRLHASLLRLSGHGEPSSHPAETASGAGAQGLGHAVGLALAERLLAARFGRSLVDHRTWALVGDLCVTGGLGHEAAGLAAHLGLERLTVLWDTASGLSRDVLRRFAGYGWAVRQVDAGAPAAIVAALAMATRSRKPTLLACLSRTDAATDRRRADLVRSDSDGDDRRQAWVTAGARGQTARRAWLKRLARHTLRGEFERVMAARLPDDLHESCGALRAALAASRPAMATRAASQHLLEHVAPRLPELIGADQASPAWRWPPGLAHEPAIATAMTGLALHGGLIACAGMSVVLTDTIRPALRLAALLRQQVIYVLTRDGGDRAEDDAEDGLALQPMEQLASLRAVPNLQVFRPADAIETAECWELALRRADGPSLIVLSRQPVPSLRPPGPAGENRSARGGYVLAEAEGGRQATLIATGPEVATAMAARETLRQEGSRVAVVSLPCWELFAQLPPAEQEAVLGPAPRVGIEAASGFGWSLWLGPLDRFVGFGGRSGEALAPAATAPARPTAAEIIVAVRQVAFPTEAATG